MADEEVRNLVAEILIERFDYYIWEEIQGNGKM